MSDYRATIGTTVHVLTAVHGVNATLVDATAIAARLMSPAGAWSAAPAPVLSDGATGCYDCAIDTTGYAAGLWQMRVTVVLPTGESQAITHRLYLTARSVDTLHDFDAATQLVTANVAAVGGTAVSGPSDLKADVSALATAAGLTAAQSAIIAALPSSPDNATLALVHQLLRANVSRDSATGIIVWTDAASGVEVARKRRTTAGTLETVVDVAP